jgi:TatD DNase family protein
MFKPIFPQWQTDLIDTHCHLNDPAFDTDRGDVVERARATGVQGIIDMAVDIESSRRAIENAKQFPGFVFAAVGIDPQMLVHGDPLFSQELFNSDLQKEETELSTLIEQNIELIAMIGETGIDNHWMAKAVREGALLPELAERSLQKQKILFEMHLRLGEKYNLPLSIHSRGAEDLCIEMVEKSGAAKQGAKGIFHCFTGTPAQARMIIDLGWGIGLGGMLTFKSDNPQKEILRELLADQPLNKHESIIQQLYSRGIYLETDAPYLAPEPHRGTRNEPSYLVRLLDQVN